MESLPTRIETKLRRMQLQLPDSDPDFLAGMQLRASALSRGQLGEIERALGWHLPDDLVQIALTYDLGGLELGGVVFGDETDFSAFLLRQITQQQASWGDLARPSNLLLLGGSDGYLIMVDCSSAAPRAARSAA